MKIGVFDSGIGGLSVANAVEATLPEHEIIFVNDKENVPYGSKQPDELLDLVTPILRNLVDQGCQVIIIACNTVSTTLIDRLREDIKVPLIAMEPMVKPAAELTKTGKITICATPTTLASKQYAWLKDTYAKDVEVIEPDCSNWSNMIEKKKIDRESIAQIVESSCDQNSDVIVLGCTHYHWIEDIIIEESKGRATVIQPELAVIEQLKRVLGQLA